MIARIQEVEGLEIAVHIGTQLSNPDEIARAYKRTANPTLIENSVGASGSLAMGSAGTAVLMSALDRVMPGEGWSQRAHAHLTHAAQNRAGLPSLFLGWSGLHVAAEYTANGSERYLKLRRDLRQLIGNSLPSFMPHSFQELTSSHQYELIAGLAGLLVALDRIDPATATALDFFDWMTADESGARWRLPNETDPDDGGPSNNLGVSHGIAGVLSAIMTGNAHSERELRIVSRIADWLCNHVLATEWGPQWSFRYRPDKAEVATRASWCYGSPGVGVVLYRAGRLLGRTDIEAVALDSLRGLARMPRATWYMFDDALCHGTAGNAVLLDLVATATGDPELAALANSLFKELFKRFNPDLPLGYLTFGFDTLYESPGLLEGATGIALASLTGARLIDHSWLRVLGIV